MGVQTQPVATAARLWWQHAVWYALQSPLCVDPAGCFGGKVVVAACSAEPPTPPDVHALPPAC